jgi:hypothetical protein
LVCVFFSTGCCICIYLIVVVGLFPVSTYRAD